MILQYPSDLIISSFWVGTPKKIAERYEAAISKTVRHLKLQPDPVLLLSYDRATHPERASGSRAEGFPQLGIVHILRTCSRRVSSAVESNR